MSQRTIRDIIEGQTPLTTQLSTNVEKAATLMKEHGAGAILVLDDVNLVGIFTERDALYRVAAAGLDPQATPISEVMTTEPTTVHPDKRFDDALGLMHAGKFRHVPVVEDGRVLGMVSSLDAMGPELEQFMYALITEDHNRDVLA